MKTFTNKPTPRITKKTKSVKRITQKERKENSGYTSILNSAIRSTELPNTELRVYLILASYYNKAEGFAFPTTETIEREAMISRTTRKKVIKNLIKKGFITRKTRNPNNNAYLFPLNPLFEKNNKQTEERKKKPYYQDDPMYKKDNKWLVKSTSRGWLEFAGKEQDIEWK